MGNTGGDAVLEHVRRHLEDVLLRGKQMGEYVLGLENGEVVCGSTSRATWMEFDIAPTPKDEETGNI